LLQEGFQSIRKRPALLRQTFQTIVFLPALLRQAFQTVGKRPALLQQTFQTIGLLPALLGGDFHTKFTSKSFCVNTKQLESLIVIFIIDNTIRLAMFSNRF
jgi:hypothetical protein